jgi:hypothetical protein
LGFRVWERLFVRIEGSGFRIWEGLFVGIFHGIDQWDPGFFQLV